jgi:murein DD-endopeptidase MepM/ murein hydrolase activator NlpD
LFVRVLPRSSAGIAQLGVSFGLLSAAGFVAGFTVGASTRPAAPSPSGAPLLGSPALEIPLSQALLELRRRGLTFPVDGQRPARLANSFDDSRGGGRRHRALDIAAPRHTPVRAVDDGILTRLTRSALGGLSLYQVDAQGRYGYYYAHLDRYAPGLREGQRVGRGDIVAYVGSTGNAAGRAPHLHFAIHRLDGGREWSGAPVNPYLVLRTD